MDNKQHAATAYRKAPNSQDSLQDSLAEYIRVINVIQELCDEKYYVDLKLQPGITYSLNKIKSAMTNGKSNSNFH